jgi:coenzyme F420 biosynthesis associated uncharacterized protein
MIARSVARRLTGEGHAEGSYLLDRLRGDLEVAVPRAERLVADASGIPAPPPVPWGLIDRGAWVDANITGMSKLLEPLGDVLDKRFQGLPLAARLAQRALVSVEVGVLLGYVSRRVLGQYDLLVPEGSGSRPGRGLGWRRRPSARGADGSVLYFVAPNIVETERKFGFVPHDFALWVALHEVTHRFQFDGVPWLRERFLGLVTRYLSSVNLDGRTLAARLREAARSLLSGRLPAEERNPVYLLASADQRIALDEIQALMAVVEGHGNYVMDTIGAREIPTFRRMRHVFERRRQQTSGVQRAIQYAIGLEMKLRQYEMGQRFCELAVAHSGEAVLGHLWVGPDNLPTLAELKEPERWLRRVA